MGTNWNIVRNQLDGFKNQSQCSSETNGNINPWIPDWFYLLFQFTIQYGIMEFPSCQVPTESCNICVVHLLGHVVKILY